MSSMAAGKSCTRAIGMIRAQRAGEVLHLPGIDREWCLAMIPSFAYCWPLARPTLGVSPRFPVYGWEHGCRGRDPRTTRARWLVRQVVKRVHDFLNRVVQSHQCTYKMSMYEVAELLEEASTEWWIDLAFFRPE